MRTFKPRKILQSQRLPCLTLTTMTFLLFGFPQSVLLSQQTDFNRDIRPILSENCFFCHGQDPNKREADLRLDIQAEAYEAGAIEPGEPNNSSLIERINSSDRKLVMPPPDSNRQLTDKQKKALEAWISQGGKYQTHWAFEKPTRPKPPKVSNEKWIRNSIDRFVMAKLDINGLRPSPVADRHTLIKRLSIDLIGLPPTKEEIDAFVKDQSENAYEKLVDRLLKSPHYGERQAIGWLDAARYSDSNGFQQDGDTWQWIWRDWLVKALNDDMPFDKLTIWMLAGDLLPGATIDQKIASGFNRNHMQNGEGGAIGEEQRFVGLFDRVDTTSQTWLGLTMACAQCHDHKYDPISQEDYYRFLHAFNQVPETGRPETLSPRIRVARPYLTLPTEENKRIIADYQKKIQALELKTQAFSKLKSEEWEKKFYSGELDLKKVKLPQSILTLQRIEPKKRTKNQKAQMQKEWSKFFQQKILPGLQKQTPEWKKLNQVRGELGRYRGDQIPRPMIMSDSKPRKTHILKRGEYLSKGKEVSFSTPAFLPPLSPTVEKNRLGLAKWIIAPENPLTARVQVNRMWQYFFGAGIVKSVEDLGTQSQFPIHKDLLDWLAVEYRESGWKTKKMHRLIVMSATYRQSSRVSKELLTRDQENRFYARASRFRMPSMILRDWALASSGLLNKKIGGQPVYPYLPKNVWETLAITKERDFSYPLSKGNDLYRRSLYTFWRRTVQPANMFDSSNRQSCKVRQSTTSTPLHALTTMNDPTWVEASRVLAEKCLSTHSSLENQIQMAFQRVVCRDPKAEELKILTNAYKRQIKFFNDSVQATRLLKVGNKPVDPKSNPTQLAAFSAVCLAILNLDESLTRQ